jgi:hypothetical protein
MDRMPIQILVDEKYSIRMTRRVPWDYLRLIARRTATISDYYGPVQHAAEPSCDTGDRAPMERTAATRAPVVR